MTTKATKNQNANQGEIKTDLFEMVNKRRKDAIKKAKEMKIEEMKKQLRKKIISICLLIIMFVAALFIKYGNVSNAKDNVNTNTNESVSMETTEKRAYTIQGILQGKTVIISYEHEHYVPEEYASCSEPTQVTVILDDNGTKNDVTDDKIISIVQK